MKRFISSIFVLILLFTVTVPAQVSLDISTYSGKACLIKFPSTNIDSTETIYSEAFSIAGFDYEGFSTYPIQTTWKLLSTTGLPKITVILQGTNDIDDSSSWLAVDTLTAVRDSLETYQKGTITLNLKKFAYYRLALTGGGTLLGSIPNRSDTTCKLEMYIPRKRVN